MGEYGWTVKQTYIAGDLEAALVSSNLVRIIDSTDEDWAGFSLGRAGLDDLISMLHHIKLNMDMLAAKEEEAKVQ